MTGLQSNTSNTFSPTMNKISKFRLENLKVTDDELSWINSVTRGLKGSDLRATRDDSKRLVLSWDSPSGKRASKTKNNKLS